MTAGVNHEEQISIPQSNGFPDKAVKGGGKPRKMSLGRLRSLLRLRSSFMKFAGGVRLRRL